MPSYQCTVCGPGGYTTDNKSHLKSHLGSKRANHNMGPFLCGFQGCNERAVRGENNDRHSTPRDHQAQFATDATLVRDLNAMVLQCVLPPTAPPPPSTPLAPPVPSQPAPTGASTASAVDDSISAALGSITLADRPLPLRYPMIIDPASTPDISPEKAYEHGAPTRRYLNKNITPTLLEGMKLVTFYQPKKPLEALGEYFLTGVDTISDCEKAPYSRNVVNETVMEGVKLLAQHEPEDGKKWFGEWLVKRSAELEED